MSQCGSTAVAPHCGNDKGLCSKLQQTVHRRLCNFGHRVDAAASAAHSNTIPGVNTGTDFRTFELPAYRSTDIVDACVGEFLANAYHPCYLFLHEL